MKLLMLCTDAFGGYGGIALYNRDLATAIAMHPAVDELVMVPRLIRGERQPIPGKIRFIERAARGRAAYALEIAKLARKRRQFDLVICAHINLLPVARIFARRTVLVIYGIDAWKPRRGWQANDGLAAVLSISDITLRRFRAWSRWEGEAHLLPNAIHLDEYGIHPRDPNLASHYGLEGKRVLMTFGRIELAERYKGFDEVLDVLPGLAREFPDLAYLVAGSGGDASRLASKASALGVADRVVFTGKVTDAEKPALYGLADLYVMPSRGEGFGFVILEALASGVPVIASRLDGGFEAIREGELGRAVDPSNPAELRTAIAEALAAPREKQIPAGLAYFAFDNFVSRVHSVLDRLAGRNE